MPAPNYTQWTFYGFVLPGGKGHCKVTINRNNTNYTNGIAATDKIAVDGSRWVSNIAKLTKRIESESHRIVCDLAELVLFDTYKFNGVVNGASIGEQDLTSEKKSLFEHIFNDDSYVYTVWITRYRGDGTKEHIFSGDILAEDVRFTPFNVNSDHTSNEFRPSGFVKLKLSPIQRRLEQATVRDFIDAVTASDLTEDVAIYGGATIHKTPQGGYNGGTAAEGIQAHDLIEDFHAGLDPEFTNFLETGRQNDDNKGYLDPFVYTSIAIDTLGGNSTITFDKILSVMGGLDSVNITFSVDPSGTNFVPIKFYLQNFNNTAHRYELTEGAPNKITSVALHYEGVFGIDPTSGAPIEDDNISANLPPVTYTLDTPLTQFLKDFCIQFGLVAVFEIAQSGVNEGKTTVRLLNRLQTRGTLPTTWEFMRGSQEDVSDKPAKAVKVQYRGDGEEVYCPRYAEDALKIEIPWRTHNWANHDDGKVYGKHLIYDNNYAIEDQQKTWEQFYGGWHGSACLLYPITSTSNTHYPSQFNSKSWHITDNTNWSGAYVIDSLQWSTDTTTRYEHSLFLYARLYANIFVKRGLLVRRSYIGLTNDSDSIHDVQPLILGQWYYRGGTGNSLKSWIANEIEFELLRGTANVLWEQTTSADTLDVLPIILRGKSSSGSGGSTPPSGGQNDSEAYVANNPTDDDRNVIKPFTADTKLLVLRAYGSGSAKDYIRFESHDGATLLSKFNVNGELLTYRQAAIQLHPYGTGAGNTGELRFYELAANGSNYVAFKAPDSLAADNTYTLPTAYPGTSGYVLSSTTAGVLSWAAPADLSTAVILSPATANRNRILPTADSVIALELKKRSTSTANLLSIFDESNSLRVGVDQNFNLTIDSADLSITTVGDFTLANGITSLTQGSIGSHVLRLISTATNDDPQENFWHGRATTTDATTWTTVATFQTTSNTGWNLFVKLLGVRTGGTSGNAQDTYSYGFIYAGKNAGGTVTVIGGTTLWAQRSTIATTFRANVNGTTVQIQVQGAANTNITWHSHIRDIALGS